MAATKHIFDIGEEVYCDICGDDFTENNMTGGFLFQTKAVCPRCAPSFEKSAKEYGEEHFIRAWAEPGETFKDFCLRLRGGNNKVIIETFERR